MTPHTTGPGSPRPPGAPAASPVRRGRRRAHPAAVVAAGLLALGALAGCAEAEQVARTAVEDAAREAVVEATAGAGEVGSAQAREQARDAVDDALAQVPGTCRDLLRVPEATREEYALQVLRGFWLSELTTQDPPTETAEAFAEAVAVRCEDSLETAGSDVITEVWETGEFAPGG
ncbi:hypothetical protein [Aquipuribacter sp. SD81]|uniref:hypothetical protein n=1 Tax=Aquipuribacter sp. SD81 TaxID=3127703 RepID=UPI0030182E32